MDIFGVLPKVGYALFVVSSVCLYVCMALSFVKAFIAPRFKRGCELKPCTDNAMSKLFQAILSLGFLALTLAMTVLLALLLGQRYEVAYVAAYTSRQLPLLYRISAIWAGQEGSMMLWGWFGFLSVAVFTRLVKSLEDEPAKWVALFAITFAQAFTVTSLCCKNMFSLLPHKPTDGQGLNPLLQNPWMLIHPPITLLGYALTSIPFALSFPFTLSKGSDDGIVYLLRVCALIAWLMLGAGIIIGAYWSYEVLGWGGYWGWDPVENASLVVFLLLTALLHVLAIQRRNDAGKRMIVAISMCAYLSVICATFITRSGILSEASVHVFGEAHAPFNVVLLFFIIAYTAMSVTFLAWYWKDMPSKRIWTSVYSLNFMLWLAVLLLLVAAFVVAFGTALPVLTVLIGEGVKASPDFFNRALAPFAFSLLIILILVPLFYINGFKKRVLFVTSLSLGCIAGAVAFLLGIRNPYHLAIVVTAVSSLASNVYLLWRVSKWYHLGGCITHIGVATLMLGISLSSECERSKMLLLTSGETSKFMGYNIVCDIESNQEQGKFGKTLLRLSIRKGRGEFDTNASIIDSPFGIVRYPGIKVLALADIYVSPIELTTVEKQASIVLRKGETKKAFGLNIRFLRFDVSEHATGTPLTFVARALLEVSREADNKWFLVAPGLTASGDGVDDSLPDGSYKFSVLEMNADEKLIRLSVAKIKAEEAKRKVVVEFSVKPFMNLLRLGSILILVGGLISLTALVRRNA
ncbi:MAG: hypothetical protein RUDDFDWM_000503 [Candidatus Fervidibacterota bacterium]